MTLTLLPEANAELHEAAHWYDERRLGLGTKFLEVVTEVLESIEQNPERYTRIETLDASRDVRRVVLKRFPYLVICEHRDGDVIVVAVMHAGRRPNFWIDRL